MIAREKLENNQVFLYAIVSLLAVVVLFTPTLGKQLDVTISFVIAILMYSMFSQIPFTSLKESFSNRRFIWALLTVNYIAVPIIVWLLTMLLPDHPPLLLGVLFSITYTKYLRHLDVVMKKLCLFLPPFSSSLKCYYYLCIYGYSLVMKQLILLTHSRS